MQFNQVNKNLGDVNNAISEKGNVVQTVGSQKTVRVEQPKESFWTTLWNKIKACWKWITG
jgi:hypothetical protein